MQSWEVRCVLRLKLALVIAAIAPLVLSAQRPSGFAANGPADPPGTFSILGFDPETGEIGAAVQSRVFSVGNGVLWAEAGVGAVATQAVVDVSYGPQGLALLKQGMAPAAHHQEDLRRRSGSRVSRRTRGRRPAGSSR